MPNFVNGLSESVKANYDYFEKTIGHSERFLELMDRPTNEDFPRFTDEEIEYLGEEDLVTFSAVYPDEACIYKEM